MDQYGTFQCTKTDAVEIRDAINESDKPVVFAWSHNQTDCYIFVIAKNFTKLGTMPFGGNPQGRVYVSLYGRGANHFSMNFINHQYWQEKLNIDGNGAHDWARFWSWIWDETQGVD